MACNDCNQLQKQQTHLRTAITEVTNPLTLLHSLVSILAPEGALMADTSLLSRDPIKNVLNENKDEDAQK
jgi:hypothetical protein